MIIRQITLEDKHDYLSLTHEAYRSVKQLGIQFAAADADITLIEEHLSSNGVYAIQKEGRLISTLSIRYPWGNNPGPFGLPHLGWFATAPEFKQQGLGKALMQWVEEHVLTRVLKAPAVSLGTAQSHPWLIEMYKKQGFEEVAQADLGHGHTTIYLRKTLDPTLFQHWQKRQQA